MLDGCESIQPTHRLAGSFLSTQGSKQTSKCAKVELRDRKASDKERVRKLLSEAREQKNPRDLKRITRVLEQVLEGWRGEEKAWRRSLGDAIRLHLNNAQAKQFEKNFTNPRKAPRNDEPPLFNVLRESGYTLPESARVITIGSEGIWSYVRFQAANRKSRVVLQVFVGCRNDNNIPLFQGAFRSVKSRVKLDNIDFTQSYEIVADDTEENRGAMLALAQRMSAGFHSACKECIRSFKADDLFRERRFENLRFVIEKKKLKIATIPGPRGPD